MSEHDTETESLIEEPPKRLASDNVRHTWNFSLDQIRLNTTHYHQEEQEALIALFRWCIDPLHPIRREDAARRLKCSTDLIYQLLTGKYRNPNKSLKGPSDEFMKNLLEFLKVESARYAAVSTDFIDIPTSRIIARACDLARESHSPVILYGPSQIGKTIGLRHYQAHHNHGRTFMAEFDANCGLLGMVKKMATACGVSDLDKKDFLVERIKNALSSDTVVILDEMHLLKHTYRLNSFFSCIETIRRIYDHKKCGMVLCWTNLADLQNSSQDELTQIWRRGVHKIALPLMPTKGDLKAILEHHGLEFPDVKLDVRVGSITEYPYEILRQQAKQNGLKAITERIRYAQKLAVKKDGNLTWNHFVDAHLRIEKQSVAEPCWD